MPRIRAVTTFVACRRTTPVRSDRIGNRAPRIRFRKSADQSAVVRTSGDPSTVHHLNPRAKQPTRRGESRPLRFGPARTPTSPTSGQHVFSEHRPDYRFRTSGCTGRVQPRMPGRQQPPWDRPPAKEHARQTGCCSGADPRAAVRDRPLPQPIPEADPRPGPSTLSEWDYPRSLGRSEATQYHLRTPTSPQTRAVQERDAKGSASRLLLLRWPPRHFSGRTASDRAARSRASSTRLLDQPSAASPLPGRRKGGELPVPDQIRCREPRASPQLLRLPHDRPEPRSCGKTQEVPAP